MKSPYTLKKNKDFLFVYSRGRSVSCPLMSLVYVKSGDKETRNGFSVGRKTGKSVVRNQIKRRLREAYKKIRPDIRTGYDLVFVAKEPLAHSDYWQIEETMRSLLVRVGLLGQPGDDK